MVASAVVTELYCSCVIILDKEPKVLLYDYLLSVVKQELADEQNMPEGIYNYHAYGVCGREVLVRQTIRTKSMPTDRTSLSVWKNESIGSLFRYHCHRVYKVYIDKYFVIFSISQLAPCMVVSFMKSLKSLL